MNTKPIYISHTDNFQLRARLSAFADNKRFREASQLLRAELDRAILVNDETLSPDIVALDSTVSLEDLESHERETYTLTLPERADPALNRLSVFSPLGTAILGYAAGDELSWQMPGGLRRLRLVSVAHRAASAAHA